MEKILRNQNLSKPVISIPKKTAISHFISSIAFFVGRIIIFKTINPISIAFLATHTFTSTYYTTALFLLLGLLTRQSQIYISRYVYSLIALTFMQLVLKPHKKSITPLIQAILGSGASLFGGLIFAILNDFSPYFATLALLEGALTFFLSFVLNRGVRQIYFSNNKNVTTPEDFLSLATLSFCVIMGSYNVELLTIPVTYLLISLALLIIGSSGGITLSISASALLGTALVVSGIHTSQIITTLLIPTAVCSLFKGRHKLFCIIAFFISGIISLNYFMPELISLKLLYTVGLSGALFLILPQNLYSSTLSLLDIKPQDKLDCIEQFKEITEHRLKSFSNAFLHLSHSIENISQVTVKNDIKDVTTMVDEIANKVCSSCSMRPFCWENNFYNTYQIIFGILGACETKGSFDPTAIPSSFKDGCVRFENFISTTTRIYELNKLNQLWLKQTAESRGLISNQLSAVADIINGLSNELDKEFSFDEKLSVTLYTALKNNDIPIENTIVHNRADGRVEVLIKHKPCYGCNRCIRDIIPIANKVLGQKLTKQSFDCQINNSPASSCSLCLIEDKKYRISSYTAKAIKSESKVSGDSHTFMELPNGNYLLALSDGMGSGQQAREESAASIELFEDFMSAGFNKQTALDMINSALVIKSNNDFFATLDICTINLYTGVAEFVKIGASSTFIIHEGKIDVIKSSTLPVGILNTVDTDISERQLYDGDILIMITDGVLDSSQSPLKKEDWIINLLSNSTQTQPQDIAQLILAEAKNNYGDTLCDDMTILVSKLWS